MRPTRHPQSALQCPLNHILGAEANVRVLRVVMLSDVPIGVAELARVTSLQASGVARVCTRLEDLGVIEAIGRGTHSRQFRRVARAAMGSTLQQLFGQERDFALRIVTSLQSAMSAGAEHIKAAWIEGPVAQGTDAPGDVILVGVLTEPAHVDRVRVAVGRRLLQIQQTTDVAIELRVDTAADITTASRTRLKDLEQVKLLCGPPPLDLVRAGAEKAGTVRHRKHSHLDARSLEFGKVIAERIRRDPLLVEDAQRYIERRLPLASPGEQLELEEWQQILGTMSLSRLRRFLVDESPRATRLRQSSPFTAVLTDEERLAISKADRP